MKKITLKGLSILNLLGFFGIVLINYLAVILPLNNKTTGDLADQYPNLVCSSRTYFFHLGDNLLITWYFYCISVSLCL